MQNFFIIVLLLLLFYLLGRAADAAIFNIRKISEELGIKLFFLGIILGFFTSLPEMSIGVNALIQNIPEISLGNLLGGILVIFGLILGLSAVLNRQIKTDGRVESLWPILLCLFSPLLLGLDAKLGVFDGILLVAFYAFILYFLYQKHKNKHTVSLEFIKKSQILKNAFFSLLGLALVVIFSNFIIRLTLILLQNFHFPIFLIGLLIFSLGTNLPEIIVAIRSWRKNIKELSLSNLIGSALTNIFIIGVFSIFKPLRFENFSSYLLLILFNLALFAFVLFFYKTNHAFSRREGFVLFIIYIFFAISQFVFAAN